MPRDSYKGYDIIFNSYELKKKSRFTWYLYNRLSFNPYIQVYSNIVTLVMDYTVYF